MLGCVYVRVLVEVGGFGLGWRAGDLHRLGCSGVVFGWEGVIVQGWWRRFCIATFL